jgi:hypothetical protein
MSERTLSAWATACLNCALALSKSALDAVRVASSSRLRSRLARARSAAASAERSCASSVELDQVAGLDVVARLEGDLGDLAV